MVFKVLPTHIDAEFHGESTSDGFRAIRARKVGQKLKKTKRVAKLDSQVTPLSRTTPHRTVEHSRIHEHVPTSDRYLSDFWKF